MKRKIELLLVLLIILGNVAHSQSEKEGFAKLAHKDYSSAKQIFNGLLKADPKNGIAYYGMGEYYLRTGKTDSAKILFQRGIDANSSNAYNYAGMGEINLLSDKVAAELNFKDAIKKSKKDAGAVVAIAQTYYGQTPKNLEEAKRYITLAIGIDSKNGSAYFLNGLIELDKSNASDAALQFDRAIYFDPNQLDAYLYASKIMASTRNIQQAVEYINKAIAVNPQYWLAYKSLGELYYDNQKYADAVSSFETYFKNVSTDTDYTHFAYSLFFNKQYQQANELIQKLLKNQPDDYVLLRLLGYISYETKDLVNGKSIMDRFFKLVPEDKILNDDYSYYGKMLSATGNDSLAIINYRLALKKDPNQFQIYDDLAKLCNKLKNYDQSLQYSREYLNKKPNIIPADYFQLGKAYYMAANYLDIKTDSMKQVGYFLQADSLFSKVEVFSPNSYLGTFWRARVNSAIDKETTQGLAKPFYEKSLEVLVKDSVKYKKELSEIYGYLGFYYYMKEDKQNSLQFWEKLLVLDPENLKAQAAIKSLEKK